MANKLNELAVINPNEVQLVPSADALEAIREEMQDMDRFPYGRIQIGAGGVNVFKVTEPGDEEASPEKEVSGVIMFSHKANGLWADEFGKGENKAPACSSMDGVEGRNSETGEILPCEGCPYNMYGSSNKGTGRGKACKNMRRLYIMRPGDIFPLILALPPSALAAYDKYRTRIMMGGRKMYGVVTKITLRTTKSADGVEYSTPVFEAAAALPPAEAERVKQYAAQFNGAAQSAGITSDDYATPSAPPLDGEFSEIGDEDLPFAGK